MQQAYKNLYGGSASSITENKWYMRFKPANPEQLSQLDSLDIDLFDYPLDYEVLQEGDYYNDGVTPAEEIPWLYTVVNPNFTVPAGIQYQLLQRIHVPTLANLEAEAFRITGNPVDDSTCTTALAGIEPNDDITPQNAQECPVGYHWDFAQERCVPGITPPQPSPTRQPAGTVLVFDNNRNANVPVRNIRVIAKNFLKVEKTFTDNQGRYFINKEFRKVNILVRTKNNQASIRSLRRARLWQMQLPVEVHFGKFRGALNNIQHIIGFNQDARSSGARHWAAVSVHNNVQEYYDHAAQLGMGTPPSRIKVLLTNWRLQGASGAAPMFAKRYYRELPEVFVTTFIIGNLNAVVGGLNAIVNVLRKEVDVTIGYNLFNRWGADRTAVSDEVGEIAFHELAHAAHYNKVGSAWWNDLVNAEINQMLYSSNPPYGTGDAGATSQIIALGESWAYHMGHFLSDRKYAANSSQMFNQGFWYRNGDIVSGGTVVAVTGLNAHVNLLEDFSPRRTDDRDRWIPQGLYYDLIDNRNDLLQTPVQVGINDQVFNYNNQSFFNALDSDVRSMDGFRSRLLSENGNNQSVGVNEIFTFYATWQ